MSAKNTLLLIGHGSARYQDAASALRRHAESLRAEGRFQQVKVGLLNGTPSVEQAMGEIDTPTIRVVPFFMEDGYFTRVAVPQAIKAADSGGHHSILMCPPVGIHDGMAGLLHRHALDACTALGVAAPTTAVVIIGHGSVSAPGRALALHRHVARMTATGSFVRVEAACLEEAPFVADTLATLRCYPVVAVGFFANAGRHLRDDVPAVIAAERAARSGTAPGVRFHGSVALDPAMTRIILDQATREDAMGE